MKRLTFYINNYHLVTTSGNLDLSEIPASSRRRLSNVDKVALTLFSKSYQENIDEIVFVSKYGEFERLKVIIEQYQEFNEVSPIQFSGSVHNFPVGNFCQTKQSSISYNAICSSSNSISAGIVKSVISENKKVLLCCADYMEEPQGFSCIITKENINDNSIECTLEQISQENNSDEFEDLYKFLKGDSDLFSSEFCSIERVKK